MGYRNRYDNLDPYAVKVIRHRARRLIGRAGFVPADVDDIEQDLALDLLQRLPQFDPTRAGRKTFIALVVDHGVARLIEGRSAQMRDYRLTVPLAEAAQHDDAPGSPDASDAPVNSGSRGYQRVRQHRTEYDGLPHALRLDLERVIATLPPDQRGLCRRLVTDNLATIARELGVPRGTLYEATRKIRQAFEDAGLRIYLDHPDTFDRAPVGMERGQKTTPPPEEEQR